MQSAENNEMTPSTLAHKAHEASAINWADEMSSFALAHNAHHLAHEMK